VTRLAAAAAESIAAGRGLGAAETAIRAGLLRLGAGMLEDLLAADTGYAGPAVPCGRGHQARLVSRRDKNADTVLGRVRISRAWYHCDQCRHGLAPRDAQLGIAGQTMSAGLRKMTARAAAAVPFRSAASLVGELAGITLTGRRAGRRAEADGNAAAAVIEAGAAAIATGKITPMRPAGPAPDKLYVAIDGTGVPMVAAAVQDRAGKGEDGKARTREVKMAAAFTQTRLNDDGYPVRDPDSSSYLATFAPAAGFGVLMAAEARRRGAGHARQLTILGDGAPWIWNLATQYFPEATQIVDMFHAREHLHDLGKIAEFMLGTGYPGWLEQRLTELDDGDIPAILAAARALPLATRKARDRDKALHYFEVNQPRMRYADFRDLGLFIGSGVVEAGCKSVVGQRLKLSGMRWTEHGATGILTLRCQESSGRWDQTWTQPGHTHAA
jgi:hypothetical protein